MTRSAQARKDRTLRRFRARLARRAARSGWWRAILDGEILGSWLRGRGLDVNALEAAAGHVCLEERENRVRVFGRPEGETYPRGCEACALAWVRLLARRQAPVDWLAVRLRIQADARELGLAPRVFERLLNEED